MNAPEVYGIPFKSLMGLPWRYALGCTGGGSALDPAVVTQLLRDVALGVCTLADAEQIVGELAAMPATGLGLTLRAEIIWAKPNAMPESVTDRIRRSHENVFHFVKQPRDYYAAVDEIREPAVMRPQRRPNGLPVDLTPRPGQPRQAWSTARRDSTRRGRASAGQPARLGVAAKRSVGHPAGPADLHRLRRGTAAGGRCGRARHEPPAGPPRSAARRPRPADRRLTSPPCWRSACRTRGGGRPRRAAPGRTRPRSTRSPMRRAQRSAATPASSCCADRRGSTTPALARRSFPVTSRPPCSPMRIPASRSLQGLPARPRLTTSGTGHRRPPAPPSWSTHAAGPGRPPLSHPFLAAQASVSTAAWVYCHLATWRTTDPGERARALGVAKPPPVLTGQLSMFDLNGGEAS